MRIGILTLPYDNNYGGNLQRYALIKYLQSMGHDAIHLNLRNSYLLPWYKKPYLYGRRIISKYILKRNVIIDAEERIQKEYGQKCSITAPFYEDYVPHTKPIFKRKYLLNDINYDAFIVGSDQVWRKQIARDYLPDFFFESLSNINKPKIAFAVSFGTDVNELNDVEIKRYGFLFRKFSAVSVRELSGLKLLQQYSWNSPKPIHLLDPTFLLEKKHYQRIIKSSETKPCAGNLFCYILDSSEEKNAKIKEVAKSKKLQPYFVNLNDNVSIPQWLRSIDEAECVVTDSFHGLVFSLIFNKNFVLLKNQFRGNARFDSILQVFNIKSDNSDDVSWDYVNITIDSYRKKAYAFLSEFLH